MDTYSSGEDLVIKTRKPYTITKQRERWTDKEHNRFLEAVKLYGRAWQRIEEHVGTKTAVQIRSHAQKFFTKLEKEAIDKGVPVGHALEIEIPPPRSKRKPRNPYPRKTNLGTTTSLGVDDGKTPQPVPFSSPSKMIATMEKGTEALSLGNNARASPSSADKTGQYVSLVDETSVSQITVETEGLQTENSKQLLQGNNTFDNISSAVDSDHSHAKFVQSKRMNELNRSKDANAFLTDDKQASRQVPVHILDGTLQTCGQDISTDMSYSEQHMVHQMWGVQGHQNQFINSAASAACAPCSNASGSSIHQSIPSYHPIFTPIHNQDDYLSLLHVSSTFSSLIVSSLSQNPAAYAAGSLATNLWPCVNMETSGEPSTTSEGTFRSQPISLGAIAAATVAAATAWWGTHGLLPLCAPILPGYTCPPASVSAHPKDNNRAVNGERGEKSPDPALSGQQLEPECSETLDELHSDSMSPNMSLPDSDAIEKNVDSTELQDTTKKQVDRSSCGSNTTCSSEVEAKETEEKKGNNKEEEDELDATHTNGDLFRQRCRSTSNGRLAFQALFSREVLPQSFMPKKYCMKEKEHGEEGKEQVEFSSQHVEDNDGSSFMGVEYAKLKGCGLGFKPYKRCSVEARESNSQDGDKYPKRLRLQGTASAL